MRPMRRIFGRQTPKNGTKRRTRCVVLLGEVSVGGFPAAFRVLWGGFAAVKGIIGCAETCSRRCRRLLANRWPVTGETAAGAAVQCRWRCRRPPPPFRPCFGGVSVVLRCGTCGCEDWKQWKDGSERVTVCRSLQAVAVPLLSLLLFRSLLFCRSAAHSLHCAQLHRTLHTAAIRCLEDNRSALSQFRSVTILDSRLCLCFSALFFRRQRSSSLT